MLIVFTGRPATGKTTIARALATRVRAVHVRVDTIEQAIRRSGPSLEIGESGYHVAFGVAADNLRLGFPVIADAVNALAISREAWQHVAQAAGCESLLVEVICSDAQLHRRRAEARQDDVAGLVSPTWEQINTLAFEPVPASRLCLDTALQSPLEAVDQIADAMEAMGRRS